jgi:phage terminase small subunit
MTNDRKIEIPAHLGEEGANFYRDTTERYYIEGPDERLVVLAGEQLDRAKQAKDILAVEGILITGARGGKIAHPMVKVEAQATRQFMQLLRELNLSTAAAAARPPALRRVRTFGK